jgi:hypothetical protein
MLAQLVTAVREWSFSHNFLTLAVKRFGGDGAAVGVARLLISLRSTPRHRLEAGENRSLVTNEALTELASLRRDP